MRIEGEDLGPLENADQEAMLAWFTACAEAGTDLSGGLDEAPDTVRRGWRLEDRQFVRCTFERIQLFEPGNPMAREHAAVFDDRPLLRDVSFERCDIRYRTWEADDAVLDGVTISHLEGKIGLELCALRHVTLEGRLGEVWINWSSGGARVLGRTNEWVTHQERVDEQNARFHDEVDWMLDISRAVTREWCLRDLPPEKVRIDPTRMAFVSHESLEPGRALLEARDLKGICGSVVRSALASDRAEVEFCWVTPRGAEHEAESELIALLHREGLALPTAPLPDHEP